MARGMADGMVSGACHTTADTMRPALQGHTVCVVSRSNGALRSFPPASVPVDAALAIPGAYPAAIGDNLTCKALKG
eukprot:scaffold423896_cov36-Prasinocladus_malaysianus.AAC.1